MPTHKLGALGLGVLLAIFCVTTAGAQEATIHHGFFFGEKYTVDEETFGINEEGHLYEDLIKDNPRAMAALSSYRGWHTTAFVATSLSLAAFVFGGVCYLPGADKKLGPDVGVIGLASGGGLLVLGMIFEFVSWGSISSSAEIYNRSLMDDGTDEMSMLPSPGLSLTEGGAQLSLGWRF